ncbi:ATP synthase subunit I [Lentibacillus halophilus]|uniref:ATP synthase subunit I n=2 Tax=Lentibacillus halophilus TaxID=295065 RepID=A0ABN0Z7B4_9BACI
MIYLLALFVLGAGFTPYSHIFLGLILGGSVSLYNLWLLQRKINTFAASVASQTSAGSLGSMSRIAAAALAVLIALRFDASIDVISVLVGLMTSYLVIVIDFFMSKSKK